MKIAVVNIRSSCWFAYNKFKNNVLLPELAVTLMSQLM